MLNNEIIKIWMLDVSLQNKAILEFYFDSMGKSLYKEVDPDDASAYIFDYDFPGAKESWEETYQLIKRPAIVISINEVELPQTVWLAKPLSAKALTDAAPKIREMINIADEQNKKVKAVDTTLEKSVNNETGIEQKSEPELALAKIDMFSAIATEINVAEQEQREKSTTNESITTGEENDLPASDSAAELQETPPLAESTSEENDIDALLASLISGEGLREVMREKGDTVAGTESSTELSLEDSEENVEDSRVEDIRKSVEISAIEDDGDSGLSKGTSSDIKDQSDEILLAPQADSDLQPDSLELELDTVDLELDVIAINDIEADQLKEKKAPDNNDTSEKSADAELQSLLNEIRVEADNSESSNHSSQFTHADSANDTNGEMTNVYSHTNAEKRWGLLCGESKDINRGQDIKNITYSLNNHMFAIFLENLDKAKKSGDVMRLKHDDIVIVIDCKLDHIYSNLSIFSEEYTSFCYEPINKDDIKVHELDQSEVRLYRKKMQEKPENTQFIEAFIWTTSLLTSRGRLQEKTDINKKFGLKTWPNLTRLEQIPHAMQIAAVFSKNPGSLQEIPGWLGIPQRYVFAFYNAALALNMIELDSSKFKTGTFDTINISENKAKNRGFFGRLLKRLTS